MNNQESTNNTSNDSFEHVFESVSEFKAIQNKRNVGFWIKDKESLGNIPSNSPLFCGYLSKKSKIFPLKRRRYFIITQDFILYKKVGNDI